MFICYMQSSCAPPLLPVVTPGAPKSLYFHSRMLALSLWNIYLYKKTLCPTCSTAPLFDSEFSAPHLWPAVVIQETKVHRIQHCTLIPIVFSIVEIHWQALYYAAMLSFSFFSNRGHCPFSIEEWKYQMFTGRNLTRNRMVDGHRILSFSLL